MSKTQQNIKIWRQTLEKLRLISALTGRTMVEELDNFADQRLAELRKTEAEKLRVLFGDVQNGE